MIRQRLSHPALVVLQIGCRLGCLRNEGTLSPGSPNGCLTDSQPTASFWVAKVYSICPAKLSTFTFGARRFTGRECRFDVNTPVNRRLTSAVF